MKKLAELVVKILALYFFVKLVGAIGGIIAVVSGMIGSGGGAFGSNIISIAIALIVNLAIVVFLWKFSEKIATLIVGSNEEELQLHIDLNFYEVLKISVKILGVIVIIMSLQEAVSGISGLIGFNMEFFAFRQNIAMILNLIFPFIKIGIGYLLVTNKKLHKKIGIVEE